MKIKHSMTASVENIKQNSSAILENLLKEADEITSESPVVVDNPADANELELAISEAGLDDELFGVDLSTADPEQKKAAISAIKKCGKRIKQLSAPIANVITAVSGNTTISKSTIVDLLEEHYNAAKNNRGAKSANANLILISLPGFAKTAIINSWAKYKGESKYPFDNGVNIFYVNSNNPELEAELNGIAGRSVDDTGALQNKVTKIYSDAVDALERPNSVLILDEFNRSPDSLRQSFLKLINEHTVAGNFEYVEADYDENDDSEDVEYKMVKVPTTGGQRHLNNLLFCVIIMNPPTDYDLNAHKLSDVEASRARTIDLDDMAEKEWLKTGRDLYVEQAISYFETAYSSLEIAKLALRKYEKKSTLANFVRNALRVKELALALLKAKCAAPLDPESGNKLGNAYDPLDPDHIDASTMVFRFSDKSELDANYSQSATPLNQRYFTIQTWDLVDKASPTNLVQTAINWWDNANLTTTKKQMIMVLLASLKSDPNLTDKAIFDKNGWDPDKLTFHLRRDGSAIPRSQWGNPQEVKVDTTDTPADTSKNNNSDVSVDDYTAEEEPELSTEDNEQPEDSNIFDPFGNGTGGKAPSAGGGVQSAADVEAIIRGAFNL